jgi:hypothetical protein
MYVFRSDVRIEVCMGGFPLYSIVTVSCLIPCSPGHLRRTVPCFASMRQIYHPYIYNHVLASWPRSLWPAIQKIQCKSWLLQRKGAAPSLWSQNELLGGEKIDMMVRTCLMRAKICLWKCPESNSNMSSTRI